jgi:NADH-quinone oxidoreductase subunit L
MFDPQTMLWLVPGLPLLAAILTAVLGPNLLKSWSHLPTVIGSAAACVVAVMLLIGLTGTAGNGPHIAASGYTWFAAGAFEVTLSLQADTLTAFMLVTVTFIGTFIAVFSAGYMHGDEGYPRFFAVMSLFLFSMTGLVLADNFLVLYAFWEGVGLCSYLLIGFWFQRPSAAAAARKAFLMTRLGDAGFILGIMLLWSQFGHTFEFGPLFHEASLQPDSPYVTVACLLLFCGAIGKSAQFPLHVWLPDAMEGPTPASALIHAATMVTAGVYLLARCTPLFVLSPEAQLYVACTGGLTALLAALIALTQNDLKRVLAYSTISQLGYMFLGLGAGLRHEGLAVFAACAAIFHLFTHAFFKALLFLAAGSVMHAMGGVIDMRKFGGLRKLMPITHWTFLCGAAALAGLIPFAGFWSKDQILEAVLHAGETHQSQYHTVYLILFASGLGTAALTAFYTFRAYFRTFWGREKVPHEAGHHAHESPRVMTVPLIVLGVGAVLVGVVFEGFTHGVSSFLGRAAAFQSFAERPEHHINWLLILASTACAAGGIALAWYMYNLKPLLPLGIAHIIRPAYELSRNRFYFDDIYSALVVRPLEVVARVSRFFDGIVDGIVDLVGLTPRLVARLLQPIQNGLLQFYALVMMVFLTAFMTIFVLWLRQ